MLSMEGNQAANATIRAFTEEVNNMVCDVNQQKFDSLLNNPLLAELMTLCNSFLDYLRCDNGELSAFWMSYIDFMENVIFGLLRGSCEGNGNLNLNAIRSMIPWCFAYDKINYTRYLSPYFAEMTNLPAKKPDMYEAFRASQLSVQMSCNNSFGRIPVDQTTEVTVNKDTQTPGGTNRFSLKAGAIKRYYITAKNRSAFLSQIRGIVQGKKSEFQHAQ